MYPPQLLHKVPNGVSFFCTLRDNFSSSNDFHYRQPSKISPTHAMSGLHWDIGTTRIKSFCLLMFLFDFYLTSYMKYS